MVERRFGTVRKEEGQKEQKGYDHKKMAGRQKSAMHHPELSHITNAHHLSAADHDGHKESSSDSSTYSISLHSNSRISVGFQMYRCPPRTQSCPPYAYTERQNLLRSQTKNQASCACRCVQAMSCNSTACKNEIREVLKTTIFVGRRVFNVPPCSRENLLLSAASIARQ